MLDVSVAWWVFIGLAVAVLVAAIVCWHMRVWSVRYGKLRRRFHRGDIVVATTVCLLALTVIGLLLLKTL
ncbi:MAG: hypothetical protein QG664_77 [Patescibacteria group bacterium]|nr:hypothetical protein [Patescibacteria group bacterium]